MLRILEVPPRRLTLNFHAHFVTTMKTMFRCGAGNTMNRTSRLRGQSDVDHVRKVRAGPPIRYALVRVR